MEKVSVVLADWQVLFREGIHFTLSGEEDIEVIGEVTDGKEALNFIEKNPPRVAILNADRGELSGSIKTSPLSQDFARVIHHVAEGIVGLARFPGEYTLALSHI